MEQQEVLAVVREQYAAMLSSEQELVAVGDAAHAGGGAGMTDRMPFRLQELDEDLTRIFVDVDAGHRL
jgi:hypothetical protein